MLDKKYYTTQGNPPMIGEKLNKEQWLNYISDYDFGKVKPSRIVLHHTWKPTVESWNGLSTMKGMQSYYNGLGWTSAPHLYIAPDGIWLFTPLSEVGIHAGEGNSGYWENGNWSYSIGIEMVGNYDNSPPSGKILEYTLLVMSSLVNVMEKSIDQVLYFHRDFSDKTCPGSSVTKYWIKEKYYEYTNKDFVEVHSFIDNQYTIKSGIDFAAIREGPGTSYPIALDGSAKLYPGETFPYDTSVEGESIEGNNAWIHHSAGIGFIHSSLIEELMPETKEPSEEVVINSKFQHNSLLLSDCHISANTVLTNIIKYDNGEYTTYDLAIIIYFYRKYCREVGLNWVLAIAQNMHETANFSSWWAARPRRNPAGLGVWGQSIDSIPEGEDELWAYNKEDNIYYRGKSFSSWEESIKSHVAHMLLYALKNEEMNEIQKQYTQYTHSIPDNYRGVAKTLDGFNGKWAVPGKTYSYAIAKKANSIRS